MLRLVLNFPGREIARFRVWSFYSRDISTTHLAVFFDLMLGSILVVTERSEHVAP